MDNNILDELSPKEIMEIMKPQKFDLISLNALRGKDFKRIIINDGAVVINATDFNLTEDYAINFYLNGVFTAQIDLESLVCIKSSPIDYVDILID